ncbi:MAG: DUF3656 domain-containing protein [Deltaproteobacteria bacterium]|nr:DUF3656 domain-containing protein [Deltaproteobacteria bacterium]MBN2671204.1 DUF3656 domain-containing protein [Deltaproteobacteria bacterium]
MNRIKHIELLAPGGGVDAIKAAILAGANAVYCGLEKFSARDRAANVPVDDMHGVVRLAHEHHVRIYVTLNIIILETEIPSLVRLLNKLMHSRIDGIIVQDIGLVHLLRSCYPHFQIHASTQMTTHNDGQIRLLSALSVRRVNLSRELNINEIRRITETGHAHNIETEVFVHGANCISFSGLCYSSSVKYGNSGNRGRCSQPCREEYYETPQHCRFPLNLKDNSAFLNLRELYDAGVDSLKIEGRIKKSNYVYAVVSAWKKQLERLYRGTSLRRDDLELRQVYNRDFSNAFLTGVLDKQFYIDNPKDNSARFLLRASGAVTDKQIKAANRKINDAKKALIEEVKSKVATLSTDKVPVRIDFYGTSGEPLQMTVTTPDNAFSLCTKSALVEAEDGKEAQLTVKMFQQKFRSVKETAYRIESIENQTLQPNLHIAFDEITALKNQLIYKLTGQERIAPVELPDQSTAPRPNTTPQLSVLIQDMRELPDTADTVGSIYFALPNFLRDRWRQFVFLFETHPTFVPWFPAVLIDEDYAAAVSLLHALKPGRIVTNNLGIAYEAHQMNLSWIAGPGMNLANSYALRCLKEQFGCQGAFISNELSRMQIAKVVAASDLPLHYSIFHPITLMTSRQCLFHQVVGCEKSQMDDQCVPYCSKHATIVDMKDSDSLIEKSPGNYHRIFFDRHFLNTNIAGDLPNVFSSFLIDLRNVQTNTETTLTHTELVDLFIRHIQGDATAGAALHKQVYPTTQNQYAAGV